MTAGNALRHETECKANSGLLISQTVGLTRMSQKTYYSCRIGMELI
jgi:hypothetical protein